MKVTKKIFLLLAFMLGMTFSAYAQDRVQVVGKIVDEDNFELIGATVAEKGTTNAVMTDLDGKYKITVPSNATLDFAYLGMKPKSEKINGRAVIDVKLESAYIELDEVVAIGYGTVRRGELTSAITSVSGKDIEQLPVTNALQALAGRVAGLQITQASGAPGANISVKIRGGISITQSNDPLYIIDGFPSPEGLGSLDPADIASIDVMKDASATAIYGAAGANGVILITTKAGTEGRTNISFDTYIGFKKISRRMKLVNSEEFVKLEYERSLYRNNGDDYRKFVNTYGEEKYNNALSPMDNLQNAFYEIPRLYGDRPGINWQDEVFDSQTPITQNYRVAINGGTKETKYNISFAHTNDDGIMEGSSYMKNNFRARFDQKMTKSLSFGMVLSYVEDKYEGLGSLEDGGRFGGLRNIIQYRPVIGAGKGIDGRVPNDRDLIDYDIDPLLQDENGNVMINPMTAIEREERDRKYQTLNLGANVKYEIMKGLTYQIQGNLRRRNSRNDVFYHTRSMQANRSGGPYANLLRQTDDTWSYTNTLTYKPKISKNHNLDIMIGQEEKYRKFTGYSASVMNINPVNNGLNGLQLGETATVPISTAEGERDLSFFGRASYNYMRKYLFTFTYRMDGSSKFGKESKWGHFPSASIAWRAIDEDFVKNLNTFSDFKVRFGVGTAGNNNIPRYQSLRRMSSLSVPENGVEASGVGSAHLPNPKLKWETDISINLGFEFGFFDQRLQAVVDIYQNSAKDLLLDRPLPLYTGYDKILQNIGETENRGIELAITSHNISTKDFHWTTGVNITHNKNKVKKLAASDRMPFRSNWAGGDFNDYDYLIEVGNSLGHMWGYEVDGMYTVDDFDFNPSATKKDDMYTLKSYDQHGVVQSVDSKVKPGFWKYKDQNGDGVIDDNDKVLLGRASPKFYGGITNSMSYKDFDFSFIFNYSLGGQVYNANKLFFSKMDTRHKNTIKETADRFTYINERGEDVFGNPAELARINQNATWTSLDGNSVLRFNSHFVEGASFLRLSNITLGYTVPKPLTKKIFIDKMRFYASANNLFTIAGYSGFDPEVSTKPNSGMTPGIDWGAYPRAFSMIFGVNVTF